MNNTPKLEIRDGKFYLLENFRYTFRNGKYVVVPSGYRTNFASIPAVGRGLVSPIDPDVVIGALVHDFLIQEGVSEPVKTGTVSTSGAIDFVDWKQAVAIMRQIMIDEGASVFKRQVIYLSVRLWGWVLRK